MKKRKQKQGTTGIGGGVPLEHKRKQPRKMNKQKQKQG